MTARCAVVDVAVTFSPDGSRVVNASGLNYARVWDASSGAPLTPLLRHRYQVYNARFSHDSRRLVTASLDGTARIWTMTLGDDTPESVAVLADLAELVGGMRLSDSGTVISLNRQDIQKRVRDANAASAVP